MSNFRFLFMHCVLIYAWITGCYPVSFATDIHTSVMDFSPIQIVLPNAPGAHLGESLSAIGDFDRNHIDSDNIDDNLVLDFAVGAPGLKQAFNGSTDASITGAVFVIYGDMIEKKTSIGDLNQPNATRPLIDFSHPDTQPSWISGTPSFPIGQILSDVGDINHDGYADLAIGTSNHAAAFILFGTQTRGFHYPVDPLEPHGLTINNTGFSISPAGDMNGDGHPDALFGTPFSEQLSQQPHDLIFGAFTLLFGNHPFSAHLNAHIPSDYLYQNRGTPNTGYAKHVSGGRDFNQDGFDDILISTNENAYLIYGNAHPFPDGNTEYALTLQPTAGFASLCGDINGDDFPEIIASLTNNKFAVLYGRNKLTGTIDLQTNPQDWGTMIHGAEHVYDAGDLNGDGFQDIALAMPNASVGSHVMTGQVLLVFGKQQMPNEIDIEKIRKEQFVPFDYILINGVHAFDTFGAAIARIGDLQNDGFDDLLISAPTQPLPGDSTQDKPGTVYLLKGIDLFYALQTHRSTFSLGGKKQ